MNLITRRVSSLSYELGTQRKRHMQNKTSKVIFNKNHESHLDGHIKNIQRFLLLMPKDS